MVPPITELQQFKEKLLKKTAFVKGQYFYKTTFTENKG